MKIGKKKRPTAMIDTHSNINYRNFPIHCKNHKYQPTKGEKSFLGVFANKANKFFGGMCLLYAVGLQNCKQFFRRAKKWL
jgi:hypothetical protein